MVLVMTPYILPDYNNLHESLNELALDLHWSWNHATDKVWRQLDPVLWELTHNPYVVLQTVSQQRIQEVLEDPIVGEVISELIQEKRQRDVAPAWFQEAHPGAPLTGVAYFSMEFMLSEALPIYSGGLGNVAGDHLKSASDLGVPVIGIGLLYQQGYCRQVVNEDGSQQYLLPYNDPGQLPLSPLRTQNGEWLRIELKLAGFSLWLRTWKVQVGRVQLLLLDSNDAANIPLHRSITSELYGGGSELRLAQELVLGIGGWRLLETLGLHPEVLHLNEGHAAFAVLERARYFMQQTGQSFDVALTATRAGNLFTTHTAIGAGFDGFPPDLMEQYLGWYARKRLGLSIDDLLALGRLNPADTSSPFNVGYLAMRGSRLINGVSQVHRKVSQQLLAPQFPRWPLAEIPVGVVTNGVHMPSWDSPEADRVWTEACGKSRWLGPVATLEQLMRNVPDERLWQLRSEAKKTLIELRRMRCMRQLILGGKLPQAAEKAAQVFDPQILTLGFARRFTEYKRPNLLLQDPDRLQRLLTHSKYPVQLIIAGKPHPQDLQGQALVEQWIRFIRERGLNCQAIFLSDYDMQLTEELVQGVDVWLNTPRSPWEACGTSGMKVLVNGGLNLSVRDGWWDEAYQPDIGWAVDNRTDLTDTSMRDHAEAEQLYRILEEEVVPEYYNRDQQGIPQAWVNRIRESMARLTPVYSANRSVRQYTEDYYLQLAQLYGQRAANNGALAKNLTSWKNQLSLKWNAVHLVKTDTVRVTDHYLFKIQLCLGELPPMAVRVQLYAEPLEGNEPFCQKMELCSTSESGIFSYSIQVPANRPSFHYTPRLVPNNDSLTLPLECNLILWL